MNSKIFVSFHKDFPFISDNLLVPIHVGKSLSKNKLNMIGDNTGDNISKKNKEFCELTAQYWVWKNFKTDNVGFCHYRRYFYPKRRLDTLFLKYIPRFFLYIISCLTPQSIGREISLSSEVKIRNFESFEKDYLKFNEDFKRIIDTEDIIVPKKIFLSRRNVRENYYYGHIKEDLGFLEDIIKEKVPEYFPAYRKVMNKKSFYFGNMFVMKRKIFEEYSDWLFEILFDLEKIIPKTDNLYQRRVFGFLSERLLNVFLEKNKKKYKIKEVKTCFIENE